MTSLSVREVYRFDFRAGQNRTQRLATVAAFLRDWKLCCQLSWTPAFVTRFGVISQVS